MTEENANYVRGCATTLVILIVIAGGIWAYFWFAQESANNKARIVEEENRVKEQQLEMRARETVDEMNQLLRNFYSKCFTIRRFNCPNVDIQFTNYTRYSMEAVLIGLTISDKFGNAIMRTDLPLGMKVASYGTFRATFELPWEATALASLCKYRKDQLDFSFSPPFASVQTTEYSAQSYRKSDVVIKFTDGTVIKDLKGGSWSSDQIEKQIIYLRMN